MSKNLFSTAYFAPVSYYQTMLSANSVVFEACEYYEKQSYRNRCKILTANGIMDLSIPVEKPNGNKTLIRDVRLVSHGNWQKVHWGAMESAYSNSPFFEYYKDDFLPFYEKKYTFLWDFNFKILEKTFELLQIDFPQIVLTENYQKDYFDESTKDLRIFFHPKQQNSFTQTPYYQVFNEKFGFMPDLSIVDLLFNMGNESVINLQNCKTAHSEIMFH
jgi:hypothetical protein